MNHRERRSLRIGFFVSTYPTVSETFIWEQISALVARGHQVIIYANRSRGQDDRSRSIGSRYAGLDEMVRYRPELEPATLSMKARDVLAVLSCAIRRDLKALRLLRRGLGRRVRSDALALLEEQPMDVLHCHYGPLGVRAVSAREALGLSLPIVVQFHGHDLSRYLEVHGRDVYRTLPPNVDLALPVAEAWVPLLRELGFLPDRIVVHRVGVDCSLFAPSDTRVFGVPLRLLSVCRLVPKKGLDIALRSLALTLERGRHVSYDVVGDGPLRGELESLAGSLGIGEFVRFHGALPSEQVSGLMTDAHVFVAPSVTASDGDQEGTPTGVIEAMASGLPVIATRHSGLPELVIDGATGYLVAERDIPGLADAITSACDVAGSSPTKLSEMGARGRERALAHFDIRTLTDRLEGLYRGLVGVVDG